LFKKNSRFFLNKDTACSVCSITSASGVKSTWTPGLVCKHISRLFPLWQICHNGLFIAALQLCVAPRLVHATAKDNAEIKAGTKQDPVPNLTQGKTRDVIADKAGVSH